MHSCDNISYMLMNLVGEVGEFSSKVAKGIRKNEYLINGQRLTHLLTSGEWKEREAESGIRVNYMLTLMFAMVTASYQIMIRGESILGELIGGKEWRHQRKKALNDILQAIEKIQSLYSAYFEKDYIQMMSDYGREDFDEKKYSGFQMYSGDILRLCLTAMEHSYHNNDILNEIIEDIRKRPNDLNLFSPEFVEQFRIKNKK